MFWKHPFCIYIIIIKESKQKSCLQMAPYGMGLAIIFILSSHWLIWNQNSFWLVATTCTCFHYHIMFQKYAKPWENPGDLFDPILTLLCSWDLATSYSISSPDWLFLTTKMLIGCNVWERRVIGGIISTWPCTPTHCPYQYVQIVGFFFPHKFLLVKLP